MNDSVGFLRDFVLRYCVFTLKSSGFCENLTKHYEILRSSGICLEQCSCFRVTFWYRDGVLHWQSLQLNSSSQFPRFKTPKTNSFYSDEFFSRKFLSSTAFKFREYMCMDKRLFKCNIYANNSKPILCVFLLIFCFLVPFQNIHISHMITACLTPLCHFPEYDFMNETLFNATHSIQPMLQAPSSFIQFISISVFLFTRKTRVKKARNRHFKSMYLIHQFVHENDIWISLD